VSWPGDSLAGSAFDLSAATETLRYGRWFVEGAMVAIAIAAFALFWSLYRERTIRSFVLLLTDARRAETRELIDRVEASLSAYVRGQATLCLVIGLVDFVAFHLIGVPFALPLALVAGMLEAVPFFGPLAGPVPAVLMAFSVDPVKAILVVAAAVVIQNIEGYVLAPRVMANAVGVHGFVMLLAITGFGALMGVLGAILAVPLAAVAQALLEAFLFQRESAAPAEPVGRDSAGRLCYEVRELLRDVQAQIRDKQEAFSGANDTLEETLEAIALDLEGSVAAGEGFETERRAR
jgi:predicted PurR-regulated permease PerM